jgi:hypothetical protein
MSTTPIRIPSDIHEQTMRIAALCGEQPGALLAQAWREYLVNHRQEFAADLEEAAHLMRSGAVDELVAFAQDAHRVVVDEDDYKAALEDPRVHRFLASASESGERREREGRSF